MHEQWRAIPDYEGWYEVSNLGRVKRIRRGPHTQIGRILTASPDPSGYVITHLTKNGITKSFRLPVLVAKVFIPNADGLPQVNHINGDKGNNAVSNLEWSTGLDNIRHACRIGLRTTFGETHPDAKLTEAQVLAIRSRYKRYNLCRGNGHELAAEYGVWPSTIANIVNRKTWKHI